MSEFWGQIGGALSWLVAGVLFFLSLWIVLPAPNFLLLQLAVGAPEVSPLLGLLSAIALFLCLWLYATPPRFLLLLLVATLVLSSLPLLQQPFAIAQANRSMSQAFPSASATDKAFTPVRPFSWATFFRGHDQLSIRHQTKIPFANPAGAPLYLDLYQPETVGQYPAVVMLYGGGWSTGSSAENEAMGRFLAARGYVVVAIDYRHTPDYQFPAQLEDVRTALSFILERADEYEIERDRIALMGWSAGAHLAMLAGFQPGFPTIRGSIKSIVNFYGPVDLARGYAEPPSPDPLDVRQVLLAFLGGSPAEKPAAYAAASPITFVTAAEPETLPPSLLIYGGRDHIVEARFGRSLYDQLRRSGNTAAWVNIPWAEHAFDKVFNGVSNQLALHFIERFLMRTLRG
ncbi:MAG: alpha/beta hydrolase [Cyanobacteria bacterium J06649_4]